MLVITNANTSKQTVEHKTIGKCHKALMTDSQLNKALVEGLIEIDKKHTQPKPKSNYRQLQTRCKELGIKASGSTACLETRLVRHSQGTLTDSDYPKTKARAKSAKPTDTFGLSYRQAQRLVKWCKENLYNISDLPLVKNIGWDNVLLNVGFLCTTDAFRTLLSNTKTRKELTEYLGVKSQTYLEELGV